MDQVQTTEQPAQPAVKEETTTQPADQSQPATQEEPKIDFKSLIPDEYKEDKALANFQDMNQFVKSYLHAQKMVGLDKIPGKIIVLDDILPKLCQSVFNKY